MYNKRQLTKDHKSGKHPTKHKKLKHPKIIDDPKGQWAHPGEVTRIPSGSITMQGVPYPVHGVDNLGNHQMMHPGQNYQFPGSSVTEYPQMQNGGNWLDTYQNGGIRTRLGNVVPIDSYVPWAQNGMIIPAGLDSTSQVQWRDDFNRYTNRPSSTESDYMDIKRSIDNGTIDLLSPAMKQQMLNKLAAYENARSLMKTSSSTSKKKQNGGIPSHNWLDDYNS
jgi:hypothetical protein